MVGWDISCKDAAFADADAAALRALGPLGEFSVEIQATLNGFARAHTDLPGFDLSGAGSR